MRPVAPLAACLAVLLIQACGRFGFDLRPQLDAGSGRSEAGPAAAADGGVDARPPSTDGGVDDSGPAADGGEDAGAVDAGCATGELIDYCMELPRLVDEPVIDGVLDCGPTPHEIPVYGWTGGDAKPLVARMAVAWRPDGIYFYVEVDADRIVPAILGADPWCGDGVEVYVDSDGKYDMLPYYDVPGTAQLIARAPIGSFASTSGERWRFEMNASTRIGDWTDNHVTVPRPGGYAFEAFVKAPDLDLPDPFMLAPGAQVGINIGINVSVMPGMTGSMPGCTLRQGQYFLKTADDSCSTEGCLPFKNSNAFCRIDLRP